MGKKFYCQENPASAFENFQDIFLPAVKIFRVDKNGVAVTISTSSFFVFFGVGSMRIELCGPLGVGKTTLAVKLASLLGGTHIKEPVETHPFLKPFYRNPEIHSFEKNMFFLLDYLHQIKSCQKGRFVFDHSAVVHRSYAALNGIACGELPAFQALDRVIEEVGPPDLLINLVCPADIVMGRIKKRGRSFEAQVPKQYVQSLMDEIQKQVTQVRPYMRVLDLDASAYDFENSQADLDRAFDRIIGMLSNGVGRSVEPFSLQRTA